MKNVVKKDLRLGLCMLALFVLWTAAIEIIDVQSIGPQGTCVGFARINSFVHELTGIHMSLYIITDWLGLVPLCLMLGFAVLGLAQWIKRKSLLKVDHSILVLGCFYLLVMAAYFCFEIFVVNYRPVLIDGKLEASYPSSTTMLAMCVMLTTLMQLNCRIKTPAIRRCIRYTIIVFTVFIVSVRLISGVHWFTDIVGGLLLSAGLVFLYRYAISLLQ